MMGFELGSPGPESWTKASSSSNTLTNGPLIIGFNQLEEKIKVWFGFVQNKYVKNKFLILFLNA